MGPNEFVSERHSDVVFQPCGGQVFVERRLVGLFCFVWVVAIIAIPRIIVGLHYPSDIVGSFFLERRAFSFLPRIPYPRRLFERALIWFGGRIYIVHALLFIFLAETFDLFPSLQGLGKVLVRLLHS